MKTLQIYGCIGNEQYGLCLPENIQNHPQAMYFSCRLIVNPDSRDEAGQERKNSNRHLQIDKLVCQCQCLARRDSYEGEALMGVLFCESGEPGLALKHVLGGKHSVCGPISWEGILCMCTKQLPTPQLGQQIHEVDPDIHI